MDEFKVIFAEQAERDLKSIAAYISKHAGPETANRFGNQLIDRSLTLVSLPERGRVVPEIGQTAIREIMLVRRWPTFALIPLLFLCAGCHTGRALKETIPSSTAVGIEDDRTERIASVVRETVREAKIPGLSLAVIDGGRVVWAQGFGWRDLERRLPVDTETQFQAGSISKPVSALGVLLLNAAGKLDLDQDVNRYFKDWRLNSKFTNSAPTLRQLLCHRGGTVPRGFAGFRESSQMPSLLDVMSKHYFFNGPVRVKYPPGSRNKYSGGGYCLAQKAVEDVTGESFEAAMNELVFRPLQMTRSDFRQPPLNTTNVARGYGGLRNLIFPGLWRVFPQKAAAGLWSTPQDLARLIIAIQKASSGETGGRISPAIAEEALKPQFDSWQGIGFRLDGEGPSRAFYHYGENVGYFAGFGAGVSNGRGWVIMTNAEKKRFDPIVNAIGKEFRWGRSPDHAMQESSTSTAPTAAP
jgi:CubicO group peptidase (beta-lactamase class C family)